MQIRYRGPVLGLSAIRSPVFRELFDEYEQRLIRSGYNDIVARLHLHSVAHFGVWIELEDRSLKTIDEESVWAFERHRLGLGTDIRFDGGRLNGGALVHENRLVHLCVFRADSGGGGGWEGWRPGMMARASRRSR